MSKKEENLHPFYLLNYENDAPPVNFIRLAKRKRRRTGIKRNRGHRRGLIRLPQYKKKSVNLTTAQNKQSEQVGEGSATENTPEATMQSTTGQVGIDGNEERIDMQTKLNQPKKVEGKASEIKFVIKSAQKPTIVPAVIAKPTDSMIKAGFGVEEPTVQSPTAQPVDNNPIAPSMPKRARMPEVQRPRMGNAGFAGVPRTFNVGPNGAIMPSDVKPFTDLSQIPTVGQTSWESNKPTPTVVRQAQMQIQPQVNPTSDIPQRYSPSDTYDDGVNIDGEPYEESESPEEAGIKRLSAFRRLGPQSQLTINLKCDKEQSVREVLDKTEEADKYTPVHLRPDVVSSEDKTVVKYLPIWPWRRNVPCRKAVTARTSKSVMLLEFEQMAELYDQSDCYVGVSVRGYPEHWCKEEVLDKVLGSVSGKSFIPCFIEFTPQECKFLVIRCRPALKAIHKYGFYIRKDGYELCVTILNIELKLSHLDFIPKIVLGRILSRRYDGERKLSLKNFTLKSDISNFIYFPLNRISNQTELMMLQGTVAWDYLTDLDLSNNRITSFEGFNLPTQTPRLKNLDLSCNLLARMTSLLSWRGLSLLRLRLEGNPLCRDYLDGQLYVRAVKMMFPALTHLDDVPIKPKGEMPPVIRNYCPSDAMPVVERFLEVFFPLLNLPPEERMRAKALYDQDAVLTVTYRYKLRAKPAYRYFRTLFLRANAIESGDIDSVQGGNAIAKLMCKWPALEHDRFTFTVDVMHHTETATVLRINGLLRIKAESLAEEEPLLAFTRTVILAAHDGLEYNITNEMVFWDEPTQEYANSGFQINSIVSKPLSMKLESAPDDYLKEKLTEIFMTVTKLRKEVCERYLEAKDWNLKIALEHCKLSVITDKAPTA